ncbi:MFS transporter [Umezakia ovalisporum]|jgi:MFS family permease|uniref:MFS transporter n=2 Tax=Umezakia ovalisporum TaxID=75695 RepID=A0AA43GZL4_9CYAN|nr:MFS transporter [Umezakia ovalisporum]MBI1240721.1 MFS transporter [Nostoc sp. RI_552]MDH6056886.1 MFS transporter [Umezakia ovalisporum FSS-43]MDH6064360.1 MFS transporter [Umezakia ovalisporum FSS-62]MDH6067974.1 MFS transporter [Umezakia ovalisporum APH033B]MDH6070926.1 MFS transporter [Umezakia ovalisporum CobakiLakeA]
MTSVNFKTTVVNLEITQITALPRVLAPTPRPSKNAIRTSLKASTLDAVFAAVFSLTTSGILLSNFLVELDASPVVFGLLCSIPMLVNIIQPLGAYLSERTTSRFQYSLGTHGIGRLLWVILVIGIAGLTWGGCNQHQLVILTLLILFLSHLLAGLGSASWLSWLAMIVPRKLRGRYFGIRNSAASLTNLLCLPLAGLAVSHWRGGTLQGYGLVLFIGIVFGIVGLGCQYFKVDVNPQLQNTVCNYPVQNEFNSELICSSKNTPLQNQLTSKIWKNSNFLIFLVYFSCWMFAVNLSAPFFTLYMLDTLDLDISWVSLYNSLQAGANLLMLILWGKLADRIGNRPILIFVGILVAITPLLWLGIGSKFLDVWLWIPILHILLGCTGAAMDLCNNNVQLEIAPIQNQSIYFAMAGAIAGAGGALGTTIGSLMAQFTNCGGLLGLFALSSLFRLIALVPLIFLRE